MFKTAGMELFVRKTTPSVDSMRGMGKSRTIFSFWKEPPLSPKIVALAVILLAVGVILIGAGGNVRL